MKTYLNNLIGEKGLDLNETFEVKGKSGLNFITLAVVIEHILISPKNHQQQIREKLVEIDFVNGNVLDFFRFLSLHIAL